jgi:hypothetical protein
MFNDCIEYNSSCFYTSKDLIHVFLCYREKMNYVSISDTRSGTPSIGSSTQSGTLSSTVYCTKTEGDLAVMVLAASDGRIGNVGFFHACPLHLLRSRQLSYSFSRGRLLARSILPVRASFNANC